MANIALSQLAVLQSTVTGVQNQIKHQIATLSDSSPTGTIKTNATLLDPKFNEAAVYGSISISLDYENHPTASFNLISDGEPFPEEFTSPNRKITLYGIPFRVNNATESIPPLSKTRKLNVSLEGWNSYLTNKTVTFTVDTTAKRYTLLDVASKVGATINGGTAIRMAADSSFVQTTLSDAISTILSNTGYFVDYSGETIQLMELDSGSSVTIPEDEILGLEINYRSELVEGVKYRPTELKWGTVNRPRVISTGSNVLTSEPKFRKKPVSRRVVVNDPETASAPPDNGRITDFQMNFDMSGPTKVREVNTYAGEVIVKKNVWVYGYTYTSVDIGATLDFGIPEGVTLGSYWGVIEQYTIDYETGKYGYYLGYTKKGTKTTRFRREEQDCEFDEALKNAKTTYTRKLEGGGTRTVSYPNIIEVINKYYKFTTIPIEEYERCEVAGYANYFSDAKPTSEELWIPYELYDVDGNVTSVQYAKNEAYTPTGFVERKVMYSNSFDWMYAPPDTNEGEMVDKIVTTGEQKKDIVYVDILPDDRGYVEYTETITAQDGTYRNSFKTVSSTSASGRPPQADYNELVELETEEPSNGSTIGGIVGRYIVYSTNYSGDLRTNESVTLDLMSDLNSAFTSLQKLIKKQYLFAGDEFTVTCLVKTNIKPGDKLTCSYRGQTFTGIVKSINHNIEIKTTNVATGLSQITCAVQNEKNNVSLTYSPYLGYNIDPGYPSPSNSGKFKLGDVSEAMQLYNTLPRRGQF